MNNNSFLNFALAIFIALALGWLLYLGRPILLPIVTALIAVYIMVSASNALHRQPVLRHLPLPLLRFSLLTIFASAVILLAVVTAATVREIANVAPVYEANVDAILESVASRFGLDRQEIWEELRAVTIGALDLRQVFVSILGGFTNVGATVFLIVIYAAFLMSERSDLEKKLFAAFSTRGQAEKAMSVIQQINSRISDYLAMKTLINVVLGLISFVILWAHGIDFALFWAVAIGLLNYIPYVGSYIGVFFPVVLSLAQLASLPLTLSLAFFLTVAQAILGNYIEPQFIGKQVNLSPVVVLVALSVWTALWGVPGAILAVPMTSVITIILGSFSATRFIAILLADKVSKTENASLG